jgi:predicted nucleic-acid-binding protein
LGWRKVRIIADTNILVRITAHDDSTQEVIAKRVVSEAELVVIPLVTLCEFFWVMRRVYKFSNSQIAVAIRALIETEKVKLDHAAVEAGLVTLDAGGDFADGVIAYEGRKLGGVTFVSFDKSAVTLLTNAGHKAKLL